MEQLAEKYQEEQEQQREHDTAKELINEATNKMELQLNWKKHAIC